MKSLANILRFHCSKEHFIYGINPVSIALTNQNNRLFELQVSDRLKDTEKDKILKIKGKILNKIWQSSGEYPSTMFLRRK